MSMYQSNITLTEGDVIIRTSSPISTKNKKIAIPMTELKQIEQCLVIDCTVPDATVKVAVRMPFGKRQKKGEKRAAGLLTSPQ